jgi:hypothetical protein
MKSLLGHPSLARIERPLLCDLPLIASFGLQETAINTERRQFNRVAFDASAELITTQQHLHTTVIDLSLKGALLRLPAGTRPEPGAPCLVKVDLAGSNASIAMAGEVAHIDGDHAGVICRSIDLESITHLRRLIEINLGDSTLLERDLKALISAG